MITIHIICSSFPPSPGGLERWTQELAVMLGQLGFRPVVYVCEPSASIDVPANSAFEVVDIAALARVWLAPLKHSNVQAHLLSRDNSRVTYACLKAEISKRRSPGRHVLLSNFVTTSGFLAHLVAEQLSLPHVAVVAGTDCTRGMRNRQERYQFQEVCAAADLVVAKSEEQRQAITRLLPGARIEVVETSIDIADARWHQSPSKRIRIFSDSGFCFKKGTGVLIDACLALDGMGIEAQLEICGSDQPRESKYWNERRELASQAPGLLTVFPGYLSREQVIARMLASDIYASATLGEGCSAARVRALCAGMPIITTQCGELLDDPEADHVRLVPVADARAFQARLAELAHDLLASKVIVDEKTVEKHRERFGRNNEWPRWIALLHGVVGNG